MPRWKLTEHVIAHGAHALGCSRDSAEDRLYELMPRATYRATDRHGRELYRSPAHDHGLRWVIDPYSKKVIWIGQGAPPPARWDPEDDGSTYGDERIEITLDRAALRLLAELTGGRAADRGMVIGRALRVLYDQERRR